MINRNQPFTVPHPRNPNFTGGEDIIEKICSHLRPNESRGFTASVALCGLGGVGKSQMAIEFAYRYRAEFQFVFWFRAVSRDQLLRDYAEISKYLVKDSRTGKEPFVAAHVVKTWFETNED